MFSSDFKEGEIGAWASAAVHAGDDLEADVEGAHWMGSRPI